MRNISIIILSSALCAGCKKSDFENDLKFKHTLITAQQHINAAMFAKIWWTNGTVEILDSTFYFRFTAKYRLNDSLLLHYKDNRDSTQYKTIFTDTTYFRTTLENDLRMAFILIMEDKKHLSALRNSLSFQTAMTVQKMDGLDTILRYKHPWSSHLFD